jgi:hypothetical protein
MGRLLSKLKSVDFYRKIPKCARGPPPRAAAAAPPPHAAAHPPLRSPSSRLRSDLTEATVSGAAISAVAAVLMTALLFSELSVYLRLETRSDLVVDRSLHGAPPDLEIESSIYC